MRSTVVAVPLAFILAMASERDSEAISSALSLDQPVQPGALSSLAESVTDPGPGNASDAPLAGLRQRLSQYYPRFYNCFSGQWRNC